MSSITGVKVGGLRARGGEILSLGRSEAEAGLGKAFRVTCTSTLHPSPIRWYMIKHFECLPEFTKHGRVTLTMYTKKLAIMTNASYLVRMRPLHCNY